MHKLISASILLFVLIAIQSKSFAATLNCTFKYEALKDVKTIQISKESLIINKEMEIPLEKTRVKCGSFGRQTRLDGSALGYQVVLKSCTSDAQLEGSIIDSVNEVAADVLCHSVPFKKK